MSKIFALIQKLFSGNYKYYVISAIFIVITFLVGETNIFQRYRNWKKIERLEREIERYRNEIENNKRKLEELQTNKDGLERFAREEYLMKKDDEDIFIISDE
jgi:cell division protein FtsB